MLERLWDKLPGILLVSPIARIPDDCPDFVKLDSFANFAAVLRELRGLRAVASVRHRANP